MTQPKALCWSRGPRIGDEGVPYCKLPARHEDNIHRSSEEDGWGGVSWPDPPMIDYNLRARDQWERIVEQDERERAEAEAMKPRYPEVEVSLSTMDGNGFFIVCNVRRELWVQARVPDAERQEFFEEALSGDYDHLLQTCMRWVTVL